MNVGKSKSGLVLLLLIMALYLSETTRGLARPRWIEQKQEMNISAIPLPGGVIELKKDFRFPEIEGQGLYLAQPEGFALDSSNNLYVSDIINNEIYAFNLSGKHIRTFGRTGQGPGDFQKPAAIVCSNGNIIVREIGNMRFQFFDLFGKYLSSFKIFRVYTSFAVVDKRIYAALFLNTQFSDTKETCLVDVLDFNGRVLQSFGTPVNVANKRALPWLNQVILSPGSRKELWVAFKCFPIVRKYRLDGKLLAEYHYRYDIADKKAAINASGDSERLAWVINAACATDRGLYLIDSTAGNRFLIFLMGEDGKISDYYWAPIDRRGFTCNGLLVQEGKNGGKYYVLNASEACIDVYSAKR